MNLTSYPVIMATILLLKYAKMKYVAMNYYLFSNFHHENEKLKHILFSINNLGSFFFSLAAEAAVETAGSSPVVEASTVAAMFTVVCHDSVEHCVLD